MRMWVRSLASFSGLRIQCCCELCVGHSWDLALLWLWHRLVAATLIQPLAWELPYTAGAALKRKEKSQRENLSGKENSHWKDLRGVPVVSQWK